MFAESLHLTVWSPAPPIVSHILPTKSSAVLVNIISGAGPQQALLYISISPRKHTHPGPESSRRQTLPDGLYMLMTFSIVQPGVFGEVNRHPMTDRVGVRSVPIRLQDSFFPVSLESPPLLLQHTLPACVQRRARCQGHCRSRSRYGSILDSLSLAATQSSIDFVLASPRTLRTVHV
jgi:hypothetical protein